MSTFLKTLATILVCASFSSCAFYTPQYDVTSKSPYDMSLKEVVTPVQVKDRYGEQRIARADSGDIRGSVFENDMIRIFWVPTEISMAFTLNNKTENSLSIMWGDAVYVDVEGVIGRVTHGSVKYEEFYYPATWPRGQKPSVVVSKSSVSDMVLPLSNTHAAGGEMAGTGYVSPMLPGEEEAYVGKTIQVLLPLKMDTTVIEYNFVFSINGVSGEK